MKKQTTTTTTTRQRVCHLARTLATEYGLTTSEAMTEAWAIVKNNPDAQIIIFDKVAKKDRPAERTARLVANWDGQVKGTGRPLKEGQKLYTDLAKRHYGSTYDTISVYTQNLREAI